MQAYCVKCRAKREIKDAKAITMKNGRPATQGVCPTCGTKMFRSFTIYHTRHIRGIHRGMGWYTKIGYYQAVGCYDAMEA